MVLFHKRFVRIIAMISVISITSAILFGTSAFAEPSSSDSGASTSDSVGTSMYDSATALTAFASNVVGANVNDKHADTNEDGSSGEAKHRLEELTGINVGNAGCIIGYGDKENGFIGYIAANETRNVTTSSYGAYSKICADESGNGGDGAYVYARYGRLLNDLGIDSTGNPSSVDGSRIGGRIVQGCYLVASFIPKALGLCLRLLKMLNPFRFFIDDTEVEVQTVSSKGNLMAKLEDGTFSSADLEDDVVVATESQTADSIYYTKVNEDGTSSTEILSQFDAETGFTGEALQKISKFVTDIYLKVRALGMYSILPLLLVLLLFGIFYRKGMYGSFQGMGKKILVWFGRFAFVAMGIPLLGMFYTSCLESVDYDVEQEPPSAKIVAATFVDFENWVKTARLEPPEGVTLTSEGLGSTESQGRANADTWRTVRDTIYAINESTKLYNLPSDGSGLGITSSTDNTSEFNTNVGMWDYDTGQFANDFGDTSEQKRDIFTRLNSLLSTYGGSEFYTASAWESDVNSAIQANYPTEMGSTGSTEEAGASSQKESVWQMHYDTDEVNDWMNRTIVENNAIFIGDGSGENVQWAGQPFNLFANGSNLGLSGQTFATDADLEFSHQEDAADPNAPNSIVPDKENPIGLSTLSMYNYLSSAFNQSNIAVYSAVNTTSEYTRLQHYAANVAGTGATQVAFLVNAFVCLGIFVLIGLIFCFGMFFKNIKMGISLIMSVPAAMLGMLKSITQVIVYVVGMVVNLVGTVILYQVLMSLIMVMASIVEGPIMEEISDVTIETSLAGGLFASIGNGSFIQSLALDRGLFLGMLIGALLLAIAAAVFLYKLRRPILIAYAYATIKLLRWLTCPEFLPVFDSKIAQMKHLYIWDEVIDDIENAASKVQNARKKPQRRFAL